MGGEAGLNAVILARAGSQRLVGKNCLPFGPHTLSTWAVKQCLAVEGIDRVLVSTDIRELQEFFAVHSRVDVVQRPTSLAGPEADSLDALRHALEELDLLGNRWGGTFLVQPTSPLRECADYARIIERWGELDECRAGIVSAFSEPYPEMGLALASPSFRSEPAETGYRLQEKGEYQLNGAFYLLRNTFIQAGDSLSRGSFEVYQMDPSRSIDIDLESDHADCLKAWGDHPDRSRVV